MYLRLLGIALVVVCCLIGWRLYSKYTAYDRLAQAPHHQYIGAENPSLVITEIMDYRCPYCRQMHDSMTTLVALHPEIRVVYRVYPIFKHQAIREAKMAMAAGMQGKFEEMHNKLIRREEPVMPEDLEALISELGLDKEQFEKDMLSWSATKDLLDSSAAVEALGIKSTPTLIVDKKIYLPREGVPNVEDLEKLLAEHLAALPSARKTVP